MHRNEVTYQYTLLQYNDQVAKVHVCRSVSIGEEFTKSMPSGNLTVIGWCSDNDL